MMAGLVNLRGEICDGKFIELRQFFTKIGEFSLIENKVRLRSSLTQITPDNDPKKFKIKVLYEKKPINETCTYSYQPTDENNNNAHPNLKVEVKVKFKINNLINLLIGDEYIFRPKLGLFKVIKSEKKYKKGFELNFNDSKGNEYVVEQKWNVAYKIIDHIRLEMKKQNFETILINDDVMFSEYAVKFKSLGKLKNENVKDKRPIIQSVRGYHGFYAMTTTAEGNFYKYELFKVEVLHVVALEWSSVRIILDYDNNANKSALATSHLIDPSRIILSKNEMTCLNSPYIRYDSKFERAMLVRNLLEGDAFIIIGIYAFKFYYDMLLFKFIGYYKYILFSICILFRDM